MRIDWGVCCGFVVLLSVGMAEVGVQQADADLTAVAGVDGARGVDHGDAELGGQP